MTQLLKAHRPELGDYCDIKKKKKEQKENGMGEGRQFHSKLKNYKNNEIKMFIINVFSS